MTDFIERNPDNGGLTDPAKVSYFLTFFVCQLAHEIEDQDDNFFSNEGVQTIMRLEHFLLQWKTVIS